MKFDKRTVANAPNGEVYPDGTTEAQRANMRAIYEDPIAYAEWRKRMGLPAYNDPRLGGNVRS